MTSPEEYNITINDKEYKNIVGLVYEISRINLGKHKEDLVKARLLKRIQYYNFKSFEQYYEYVISDPNREEIIELLNAITTNVTSFFREDKHFKALSAQILPDILERKKKIKCNKIRIWSAACATGEEVYSIIITLLELINDPFNWDIKVLGTDISTKALSRAKSGIYEAEKAQGLPEPILEKYFDIYNADSKDFYKVKNNLKKIAIFGRVNLNDKVYPFSSKPDIIFCRNVMIYFDKDTQSELIKKIYSCLDDGGYLFIGHSESLMGIDAGFENIIPAVYKKKGK